MLKIELDGKSADLAPNTTINLVFKSPVFDNDHTERAYSLPHRVAATASMFLQLQHANRLDSDAQMIKLKEKIYVSGVPIAEGIFQVEKIQGDYIDGHFTNAAKQYTEELEKIKLHELLPEILIPQTNVGRWKLRVAPPVQGRSYYLFINDIEISYNATSADTITSVAQRIAGEIRQRTGLSASNTPFEPHFITIESRGERVKLRPWIGQMESMSVEAGTVTYGEARLKNFADFMSGYLKHSYPNLSFAEVRNPKFYSDNYKYNHIINHSTKSGSQWFIGNNTFVEGTSAVWEYTYVPFFRVRHILTQILEKMGIYNISGDFPEWNELYHQLVIYNNFSMDEVVKEWSFSGTRDFERVVNAHAVTIKPKNHLPDITAREFLKVFCETFNLYWQIQESIMLFKQKNKLVKTTSELLASSVIPGTMERGFKKRQGFKLESVSVPSDPTMNPTPHYVEGAGTEVITLPSGCLAETSSGHRVCYTEEKGASGMIKPEDSTKLIRFMMHRGERLDSQGIPYLQSATNNLDSMGNVIGRVSLSPDGLAQWAWKEWARIKAEGFPVTLQIHANINTILELINFKTASYRVETPQGAATVVIDSVDVSVSTTAVSAKITGVAKS